MVRAISVKGMTVLRIEQNARPALQAVNHGHVMDSITGYTEQMLNDPKVRASVHKAAHNLITQPFKLWQHHQFEYRTQSLVIAQMRFVRVVFLGCDSFIVRSMLDCDRQQPSYILEDEEPWAQSSDHLEIMIDN